MNEVKMVTIKEAVTLTGFTETALRTGVNNGTFPALRVGNSARGKIMFDLSELNMTIKELVRRNMKESSPTQSEDNDDDAAKGGEGNESVIPFTQFRKWNS